MGILLRAIGIRINVSFTIGLLCCVLFSSDVLSSCTAHRSSAQAQLNTCTALMQFWWQCWHLFAIIPYILNANKLMN